MDDADSLPEQRLRGLRFVDRQVEEAYWAERVDANRLYYRTLSVVLVFVYGLSWISNEAGRSWPILPPSQMGLVRGFSLVGLSICALLHLASLLAPVPVLKRLNFALLGALVVNQLTCYYLADRAYSLGYFMGLVLTIVGVVGMSRMRVFEAACLAALTMTLFVAGSFAVGDAEQAGVLVYVTMAVGLSVFVAVQGERLTRLAYARRTALQKRQAEIAQLAEALREAHAQSEGLLLNMLPAAVAARLKTGLTAIADSVADATVLFADISGFTTMSAGLDPRELVAFLNQVFSTFDEIAHRHGLEKIKTIGDAYMAAAGVPEPSADHAEAVMSAAIEMMGALARLPAPHGEPLTMRIGIHSGPLVAGVIGTKRVAYDLWGDAVNTASRMESHGEPGAIHVSDRTRELIRHRWELSDRGTIDIKGKGRMRTWLWKI